MPRITVAGQTNKSDSGCRTGSQDMKLGKGERSKGFHHDVLHFAEIQLSAGYTILLPKEWQSHKPSYHVFEHLS